ncbi:hypothetical protein M885DRAFT_514649 [Pelagophyceae sp. CCMP2097]|nr:hypothetical protein M885DRAFT_514649 [Pelagophyceae sp. CCMP2097]
MRTRSPSPPPPPNQRSVTGFKFRSRTLERPNYNEETNGRGINGCVGIIKSRDWLPSRIKRTALSVLPPHGSRDSTEEEPYTRIDDYELECLVSRGPAIGDDVTASFAGAEADDTFVAVPTPESFRSEHGVVVVVVVVTSPADLECEGFDEAALECTPIITKLTRPVKTAPAPPKQAAQTAATTTLAAAQPASPRKRPHDAAHPRDASHAKPAAKPRHPDRPGGARDKAAREAAAGQQVRDNQASQHAAWEERASDRGKGVNAPAADAQAKDAPAAPAQTASKPAAPTVTKPPTCADASEDDVVPMTLAASTEARGGDGAPSSQPATSDGDPRASVSSSSDGSGVGPKRRAGPPSDADAATHATDAATHAADAATHAAVPPPLGLRRTARTHCTRVRYTSGTGPDSAWVDPATPFPAFAAV